MVRKFDQLFIGIAVLQLTVTSAAAQNLHRKYGPQWDCGYISYDRPYWHICKQCEDRGMEFEQIGDSGKCVAKVGAGNVSKQRQLEQYARTRKSLADEFNSLMHRQTYDEKDDFKKAEISKEALEIAKKLGWKDKIEQEEHSIKYHTARGHEELGDKDVAHRLEVLTERGVVLYGTVEGFEAAKTYYSYASYNEGYADVSKKSEAWRVFTDTISTRNFEQVTHMKVSEEGEHITDQQECKSKGGVLVKDIVFLIDEDGAEVPKTFCTIKPFTEEEKRAAFKEFTLAFLGFSCELFCELPHWP